MEEERFLDSQKPSVSNQQMEELVLLRALDSQAAERLLGTGRRGAGGPEHGFKPLDYPLLLGCQADGVGSQAHLVPLAPDDVFALEHRQQLAKHLFLRVTRAAPQLFPGDSPAQRVLRVEILEERHVLPGVRFAVDAYVNFARSQPWPIAIASSLTELFAPDLMNARLAAFEKFYRWIDPRGLDYFRRRVTQARRDSDDALAITLEYCNTPELQRQAVRALEFKCDVLWSLLDAIHHAYGSLEIAAPA